MNRNILFGGQEKRKTLFHQHFIFYCNKNIQLNYISKNTIG
ncbi:hypothetical protein HMPREF1475_01905 [Hoylesella oralis HGA0225]|nr:hypothetical protein HMPREF1475_01905 [Hoylesella oralis HGA0225]SHF85352.1 hypothetical protein SAMN05444288_1715 [Hoylesella oralis]